MAVCTVTASGPAVLSSVIFHGVRILWLNCHLLGGVNLSSFRVSFEYQRFYCILKAYSVTINDNSTLAVQLYE